jgi:acetyl-CoA C-acetyltransferase
VALSFSPFWIRHMSRQAFICDAVRTRFETAEIVATDYRIEREAQDRMAHPILVSKDEHPRETSLEALARLKGVVRPDGCVTAGNASGVNDGAVALLLADEASAAKHGLTPRARVVGMATAGVAPRIMGIGPAPATQKVL